MAFPAPLLDLPEDKLDELTESVAVNWLANDGVWFQAVEFTHGLFDAKRCNDTCWAHFSPFRGLVDPQLSGSTRKPRAGRTENCPAIQALCHHK